MNTGGGEGLIKSAASPEVLRGVLDDGVEAVGELVGYSRGARVAASVAHVVPRVRRHPRPREVLKDSRESPGMLVHAVRPYHRREWRGGAARVALDGRVGVPRLVVNARARVGL